MYRMPDGMRRPAMRPSMLAAVKKIIRIALLLALLGAAFLLYSVLKIRELPSVIVSPTTRSREMQLYRHVEKLAVEIGSRSVFEYDKLSAAKEYILSCLTEMGYLPDVQEYSYQKGVFSNIIVSKPGTMPHQGVVVIGAHYDTVVGTPGADDNASAVALLLELCRLVKDCEPERTIRLVFFALEEPPIFRTEFMGSAVYARAAKEKGETIAAMIALEMLGYYSEREGGQGYPLPLMSLIYPSKPDFIAVVGNMPSRSLVEAVAGSLRKSGGVSVETLTTVPVVPGVDFSDHRSFWEQGYPAVMITDTAFFRNPNYHSGNDTIDTLDFERMSLLLRGLLQVAKDLADAPV